jgi:quercetin dioxygenase-like cupin family protein
MMAGMSEMTRRDFGMGSVLLMALGARVQAQDMAGQSKVLVPMLAKQANGTERWNGPTLTLGTGELVSMHESVVPAGTPKVAAHVIKHSELIFVAEGAMSFQHDGMVDEVKAGSVIYVAYGTDHLVWNSGETTARYMVFQLGGDTKGPAGRVMPVEGSKP